MSVATAGQERDLGGSWNRVEQKAHRRRRYLGEGDTNAVQLPSKRRRWLPNFVNPSQQTVKVGWS